jgi:hypothetical protein
MSVHPYHEPAPPDDVENNYLGLQDRKSEHPPRIEIAMVEKVSHWPIVVIVILDDEVVEVVDDELQDVEGQLAVVSLISVWSSHRPSPLALHKDN